MSRKSPGRGNTARSTAAVNGKRAEKAVSPSVPAAGRAARHPLWDPRLWAILVLTTLLAIGFAYTIPVGANPDEPAHVQFVKTVATEYRLPALNVREHRRTLKDSSYEAHQAPLYYVLAAPFYRVGEAFGSENGPAQACRVLSLLIGLAGTVLVWLLAREVAPDRPALWIAATAVVAFLPMRLAIIASVSNDALAEATATGVLLVCVRALKGPWGLRQWLLLGLSVSLALMAKQSNLLLLLPALLTVPLASVAEARRACELSGNEPSRSKSSGDVPAEAAAPSVVPLALRSGGIAAVVVILVAGWWFVRNQVLYGDPLAQRAFNWYFSDTWTWAKFRDLNGYTFGRYMFEKVIPTAFDSFWGAFGYLTPELFMGAFKTTTPVLHWDYPPQSWVYPILWIVTGAAALGGVAAFLRWRSKSDSQVAEGNVAVGLAVSLLGLHAVFVAASFLRFNTQFFQAQGRYFFPALAAIALALAAGWLEWMRPVVRIAARRSGSGEASLSRWEGGLAWSVVTGMLVLAGYALFGLLMPSFAHS